MKFNRFEEIIAWRKAKELTKDVYLCFEKSRDFGFKDQIQRASISIMNNIAEGFERKSNNEFKYFLFIAKGSCGEVRSMLILAHEMQWLNDEIYLKMYNSSIEISKMLSGLIKSLTSL